MKFKIKDYFFLLLISIAFVFFVIQKNSNKEEHSPVEDEIIQSKTIEINKNSLLVEVISTKELRFKGLGGTKALGDNEGVLFVHERPDYYVYSMRGMSFDLDFIFINGENVVDIAKSVSYKYNGVIKGGADYDKVIEVNADWVRENKIKIGDFVDLNR